MRRIVEGQGRKLHFSEEHTLATSDVLTAFEKARMEEHEDGLLSKFGQDGFYCTAIDQVFFRYSLGIP